MPLMLKGQNGHRGSRMEGRWLQGRPRERSQVQSRWGEGEAGVRPGPLWGSPSRAGLRGRRPGPCAASRAPESTGAEGAGTGRPLVSLRAKCKRVLELDISSLFLVDLKHVLTRNVTGLCAAETPANG